MIKTKRGQRSVGLGIYEVGQVPAVVHPPDWKAVAQQGELLLQLTGEAVLLADRVVLGDREGERVAAGVLQGGSSQPPSSCRS